MPVFWAFTPAYARVQNEHVWPVAWVDITTAGMTPGGEAFKRVNGIFAIPDRRELKGIIRAASLLADGSGSPGAGA